MHIATPFERQEQGPSPVMERRNGVADTGASRWRA